LSTKFGDCRFRSVTAKLALDIFYLSTKFGDCRFSSAEILLQLLILNEYRYAAGYAVARHYLGLVDVDESWSRLIRSRTFGPWLQKIMNVRRSSVYQVKQGQAIGVSPQKIWNIHSIPISTKILLMKALVWLVATSGCESWTLRKNEETRLESW